LNKILVVEDERSMRDLLGLMLRKEGYSVETAESAEDALELMGQGRFFDLVITDISMSGMSGLELLRHTRGRSKDTEVILMTAFGSKQTAIDALNDGATYYVEKPFDLDEMKAVVRKTLQQTQLVFENADLKLQNRDLRAELKGRYQFEGLIGGSEKMKAIYQLIRRVAATGSTVMVSGESGTGKELIASAIHENSLRKDRSLVRVNCASIPRELFESEFFGHTRGSFTGATRDRAGRFQVADGGTLFLDEVGEIPLAAQPALLRALSERVIRRVGGEATLPVDVRVIAATNRDLRRDVEAGRFRQDLYYRINVFPIEVAPLRARKEDIPILAAHFLGLTLRKMNRAPLSLTEEHVNMLLQYPWPGNVRELQNVLERAVITSGPGILQLNLPTGAGDTTETAFGPADRQAGEVEVLTEVEMRRRVRANVVAALRLTGWRIYGEDGAAKLLGIKATTLASRMKNLGIKKPENHVRTHS